ncbi:MAG: methyltransferase domain-containing protein [Chloroflexi bacterium]|nr:methyltransferase domain-containing protein [Chloroflexota bacterium]
MNLAAFLKSYLAGESFEIPAKIPWHEPEFSRRMLREHLSQDHDRASRRFSVIDAHAEWIHAEVLGGRSSNVLDLTCGPGLYCERLAGLGHECTGIDFSPASIEFARKRAARHRLRCTYVESDVTVAPFGSDFDLVLMVHGEFNTFSPGDAAKIVFKAADALRAGGALLLEIHTADYVRSLGERARSWSLHDHGLFSDRACLLLTEARWDEGESRAVESFFVADAETLEVETFRSTTYSLTREEAVRRFLRAEFEEPAEHAGMSKSPTFTDPSTYVLVARKRG